MLAARFHGNRVLQVEEIPIPELRSGEVRIRVAFAGICGSDVHEYHAPEPFSCSHAPHPLTGDSLPITLGHEFSGIVTEVFGEEKGGRIPVGARVCIEPVVSCRACENCMEGDRSLCSVGIGLYGYNRDGGFAHYVNVDQDNCHVIPDNVPLTLAALAEPLSVAFRAVKRSSFRAGESALVSGAGPIGLLIARILKSKGASWVGVSQSAGTRALLAGAHGIDAVFDRLTCDVVQAVRDATAGRGVHTTFECAGNSASLDVCIKALRTQGRAVVVALWMQKPQLDIQSLLFSEKVLTASCCAGAEDMAAALDALSRGSVPVADLITSTIRLRDVHIEGFHALEHDRNHVKILVDLGAV